MDPVAEEEFHRSLLLTSAKGHLQRAAAESRAAEPTGGGDPGLSHRLMLKWCYGHRSATDVNTEAILAWKAGARGGYLKQLSSLGAGGTNPQNCSQDLMSLIRKLLGQMIVPLYITLIPLFVAKSLSEDGKPSPELCPVGFILPHMWLWFLFTHHRKEFFSRFFGCLESVAAETLSAFWHNVHPADPRRGPLFETINFATRCIPLGLHGDGVPCTKKDSLNVTSLFGLLGWGTTSQIVCYLWSFFSKCKVDELTLLDFPTWLAGMTAECGYEVLIWSLLACERGIHPSHDHRGEIFTTEPWRSLANTPICGGFISHLWQFRADADYQYNDLKLPGHWSSAHPCHSCLCTKIPSSPTNFLYFLPDATWPETIFIDMAPFFRHCAAMGKRVHPLNKPREEGGLGLHVLIYVRDTLHFLDLGVSQSISGSVLWLLTYGGYVDDDPLEAIRTVEGLINELYSKERTPCRFTNLGLTQFTVADSPMTSTPWLNGKAAETRNLVPLLRVVWELHSRRSDHDNHVSAVMETLTEAYSILGVKTEASRVPLFMDVDASANFRVIVDRCLIHVAFLEQLASEHDPPLPLWHMVSKFHSFWHCAYESQFNHPSSGRTYLNEDYMQHVRAVGMANRYAVSASRRSLTVAERISLGRSLELFLKGTV